jgi:hypothetical protein
MIAPSLLTMRQKGKLFAQFNGHPKVESLSERTRRVMTSLRLHGPLPAARLAELRVLRQSPKLDATTRVFPATRLRVKATVWASAFSLLTMPAFGAPCYSDGDLVTLEGTAIRQPAQVADDPAKSV